MSDLVDCILRTPDAIQADIDALKEQVYTLSKAKREREQAAEELRREWQHPDFDYAKLEWRNFTP